MMKAKLSLVTVLAAALAGGIGLPSAHADGVKVGVLKCDTVPGSRTNLIIHSTVEVKCVFDDGQNQEMYVGETGIGLGIDLNIQKDATMHYAVLAATGDVKAGQGVLAGRYGGAKAAATVGVGAGAAVLIGGGANNISLQPLAIEGSTGLGAEAGLTYLYIQKM